MRLSTSPGMLGIPAGAPAGDSLELVPTGGSSYSVRNVAEIAPDGAASHTLLFTPTNPADLSFQVYYSASNPYRTEWSFVDTIIFPGSGGPITVVLNTLYDGVEGSSPAATWEGVTLRTDYVPIDVGGYAVRGGVFEDINGVSQFGAGVTTGQATTGFEEATTVGGSKAGGFIVGSLDNFSRSSFATYTNKTGSPVPAGTSLLTFSLNRCTVS